MCAGAAVIVGIKRVIVGEAHHFAGAADWLRTQGVDVEVLGDRACIDFVTGFRTEHPDRWQRFSAG